jgi:C4-dicarboxylate transporter DctM subunit
MSWEIIVMIFALTGLILVGVPIAFAQSAAVILYVLIAGFPPLSILAQQTITGIDSFVLLALPLFIWCGILMEKSGASDGLMRLVLHLIKHLPGGAAIASVVATTFFGALTGSAVAATAAIGQIMEPQMVRKGYAPGFVASLQGASGVLGAVIPPSIALVTYGAIAGASISALFAGAVLPGIIISGLLCCYAAFVSWRRGYGTAEVTAEPDRFAPAFIAALPALIMPAIILGGIFGGIFTPTEAAAVGAVYILVFGALAYRRLTPKVILASLTEANRSTAAIMFIIATSAALAWIIAAEEVPQQFADLVLSLSDNPVVILIIINILLLVLGTFMETIATVVILTPVLLPVIQAANVDPVVFGVIMIVNLSIGAITPPLGVCLFVATRIINIDVKDTFPDLIYVTLIMVFGLFLITYFPQTITWAY